VFNVFQSSNAGQASSPGMFLHRVEVLYAALTMEDNTNIDESSRLELNGGITTRIPSLLQCQRNAMAMSRKFSMALLYMYYAVAKRARKWWSRNRVRFVIARLGGELMITQ
jgi:hypothetical protein